MKVAFSSVGTDLRAPMDRRFGRALRFVVVDVDTDAFEVVENTQNLNAAQGAGIQAAQTIVDSGAEALVTGNCGPKAFRVLSAAGVKVYHTDAATIDVALMLCRKGELEEATEANVEGHWA